jgi:hypothetical protein
MKKVCSWCIHNDFCTDNHDTVFSICTCRESDKFLTEIDTEKTTCNKFVLAEIPDEDEV